MDTILSERSRQAQMVGHFIRGDIAAIDALLDAGLDINAMVGVNTPLMHAAACGHTALVQHLLERGAEVNLSTRLSRRTAFYYALTGRHFACARLLADAGADINTPDGCGMTPLIHAAAAGNLRGVRFLL